MVWSYLVYELSLKHTVERTIEGSGRLRRRKQILDDLKEERRF